MAQQPPERVPDRNHCEPGPTCQVCHRLMGIPVLYDGWALVRAPDSPQALHLLALLAHLPPQVEPLVALPEEPPGWLAGIPARALPAEDTSLARLAWEQARLPSLALQVGARLLHLTAPAPPLFGPPLSVISPSNFEFGYPVERVARRSFSQRARAASARGGLARARAFLWPADLPQPDLGNRILSLPPITLAAAVPEAQPPASSKGTDGSGSKTSLANHGIVTRLADLNLPETYILYHGPGSEAALRRLVEAWSWAAGPIGEYHPFLLLGLDEAGRANLEGLISGSDLGERLQVLPQVAPVLVTQIYQACTAVFNPARTSPWGGPVRQALAQGKPVVAIDDERTSAIAGPAAYLVPEGDGRALGAALITVVVEEQVAGRLSRAGLARAAAWRSEDYARALLEAYRAILEES